MHARWSLVCAAALGTVSCGLPPASSDVEPEIAALVNRPGLAREWRLTGVPGGLAFAEGRHKRHDHKSFVRLGLRSPRDAKRRDSAPGPGERDTRS